MLDLGASIIIVPARRVANLRVDVFESYGEVNHPQIKVVNTPISELLPCDGLNLIVVVERLPELGNNKQILALYETLLDGTCDTLSGFLLVTVVCSIRRK